MVWALLQVEQPRKLHQLGNLKLDKKVLLQIKRLLEKAVKKIPIDKEEVITPMKSRIWLKLKPQVVIR